jgi:N-acetyl-gamma-glutamylphosphate reductase
MLKVTTANLDLLKLLFNHRRVEASKSGNENLEIFGETIRSIKPLVSSQDFGGLIELMDNNPIVCADVVHVPSPAATLSLIALGPLTEAGLLLEEPVIMLSFDEDEEYIAATLHTVNWNKGFTLGYDCLDTGSVRAATIIAKISKLSDENAIDELYEERYGRSFMIRRDEESTWDTNLVDKKPWAVYRLRISEGDNFDLLTIQVMADINGKLGAAQYVHTLNVMMGFEESIGLV